jgi:hypothetical protein
MCDLVANKKMKEMVQSILLGQIQQMIFICHFGGIFYYNVSYTYFRKENKLLPYL